MQIGDVVIVSDEVLARNQWKLGRIADVYASDDGLVRKVKLAMADSTINDKGRRKKPICFLERPVHKLVLLLANDEVKTRDSPTKEPTNDK